MNSRVIAAIAAAVLAILGIGVVALYASSARNAAYDGAELVTVYRVANDIAADADSATVEGNVEQVSLPNDAIAKGAVRDLATIAGLKTTVPLIAGEQLLESRFAKDGAKSAGGNAAVPAGMQEMAVALDPAVGVADRIGEGARVGVIALVEENKRGRMFAQNVLVTGVEKSEEGAMRVTLAVTTQQATQIATAVQFGTVRLTVQNDKTDRGGAASVEVGTLVK